ncbi:glycosyltransferase [Falsiroseomonas sp. E2-1-a20]|uniref:glycosyltransferase n=1 Tax=Falsiroseomonas sp. E2-1-a20 TaxID=3239300 RepID=UPI003F37D3AB
MEAAGHRLMPDHRARSGAASQAAGVLVWFWLWLLLWALLPDLPNELELLQSAALIGLIGIWRWSWAAVHFGRMLVYRHLAFPRLREAADCCALPPALYIVVTSYRMPAEMNAAVYGRLLDELAAMGVPACIVACVTDPADAHLLADLVDRRPWLPEGTVLHMLAQDGTGKRAAMGEALALILARNPLPGAQLVLMDGDSLLAPGTLASTCRLLASRPELGAVTTNNVPLVKGHAWTREWYRLRMLQRDILMCSMSLSGRLLVLTGRFSVFRAEVMREVDFLRRIERDTVSHWRIGAIPLVTGDDKSTWYATLNQGWRIAYVPDATVFCLEELPGSGFLAGTTGLMLRWFGNMARSNGRALELGRAQLGTFAWLCLIDQRISPWTTLSGPLVVLYAAVFISPSFLTLYAMWVLATRTLLTLLVWLATGRFHAFFPILFYCSQVFGSLIKIFAFHHPDRQRWNRQKVASRGESSAGLSKGFLALSTATFILLVVAFSRAPWTEPHQGGRTGLGALFDAGPLPVRPACHPPGCLSALRVDPRFGSQ